MTRGVYLSVYPSVCLLRASTYLQKGLGSPKLADGSPLHEKPVNLFRGQKVKCQAQGRLMLSGVGPFFENENSHKHQKNDRNVAHPTGNKAHQFQGQKVNGQGHLAN